MPKSHTITLYTYDELPTDEAKEKARQWGRDVFEWDSNDSEWATENQLGWASEMRGLTDTMTLHWACSYCQGDGASLTGPLTLADIAKCEEGAEIGAHLLTLKLLGVDLDDVSAFHKGDDCKQYKEYGHGAHVEYNGSNDGKGIQDALDALEKALTEYIHDVEQEIYHNIRADIDYHSSDEYIIEGLQGNEYTFTEDGERFEAKAKRRKAA